MTTGSHTTTHATNSDDPNGTHTHTLQPRIRCCFWLNENNDGATMIKKSNNNKHQFIGMAYMCLTTHTYGSAESPCQWTTGDVNMVQQQRSFVRVSDRNEMKKQQQAKRIYTLCAHTDQANRIEIKYHKQTRERMSERKRGKGGEGKEATNIRSFGRRSSLVVRRFNLK